MFLNNRNQEIIKGNNMSQEQQENAVANFIQKTFQILDNKEYEKIIQWVPNGKQFAIKDIQEFQQNILPKYFRHRNINSFIRQLNMYGFHKSRKEPTKNIFSHPNFLRGHADILHLVRRKIKNELEKNDQNVGVDMIQPKCTKKISYETPMANKNQQDSSKKLETSTSHLTHKEAPSTIPTKIDIISSFFEPSFRSFNFEAEPSPLKSLIQKSYIMDYSPQMMLRMRSNNLINQDNDWQKFIGDDDDDKLSIEDEIEKERKIFENRRSGVSILGTYNFINDIL